MITGNGSGNIQTGGALFELVQLLRIFGDSKTITDAVAHYEEEKIERRVRELVEQCERDLRVHERLPAETGPALLDVVRRLHRLAYDLEVVVKEYFELPGAAQRTVPQSSSMEEHIERMWDYLTRRPGDRPARSTLLPLKHSYIVPGGRYAEFYYWDSYFTSVGLFASGRVDLLQRMVDNVADLIEGNKFAPNGTRTYYLTRSQAPYFCFMLQLLGRAKGEMAARAYASVLKKEWDFWNSGGRLVPTASPDGYALNRYWDESATPRPEGYWEDRRTWYEAEDTARDSGAQRREQDVYRHLRAAAESGWDFSSRWLKQDREGGWPLSSIRTTSVLPIDLNCLLYGMERQLALWEGRDSNFYVLSDRRRRHLQDHPFWNEMDGWFFDAELGENGKLISTGVKSIAGVFPLFCEVAGRIQAEKVASRIEAEFTKPGGVVTSTEEYRTGQQWDYPNGWAPLQWVTVVGLANYGYEDLAREIACRFVDHARSVYDRSGKMMEKYDVCDLTRAGGGGEYPNQDGFAWTNGVVKGFLEFLDGNKVWGS